ncbi:MAG: SagB/ThcOx family dehydrogenase [Undibacterium sp.]
MPSFLYHFFHNETNDRTERGLVAIPKDTNKWPEAWKKIDYKRYFLHKPIELPRTDSILFTRFLGRRKSSGRRILKNKINFATVSRMLQCGYGLRDGHGENRTVPSAGKRYPLELYLALFEDIEGCRSGIYHYAPQRHVLEPVTYDGFSREEIRSLVAQKWLADAQGMIVISSVFGRTTDKYGSRGYRYILIEAGHVAQNILLSAADDQISALPVAGANEEEIERKIGLNTSNERVVYTLFF